MHYDDVALECVMLADERAARAFVAAELAPLDRGRDGAKLRETLTAYFASGFNASAAAAMLKVNDRTIAYRLNSIEEQLGLLGPRAPDRAAGRDPPGARARGARARFADIRVVRPTVLRPSPSANRPASLDPGTVN